ncbi:MAG TPA: translocation/assembly module TamB domain-containing protein [Noviherbaspirillum sp.]
MRKRPQGESPSGHDQPAIGKPRARRRLAWAAAIIGILALLFAALLFFALNTEAGSRALWQAASRVLPGTLSGEVAGGTLSDGLQLRDVVYETPTMRVKIDRMESDWRWFRSPLTLVIRSLRLGTVDVTLRPDPSPKKAPSLPAEIRLPLAFELQSASVQQLRVHQEDGTTTVKDILVRASSDRVHHALTVERADTPLGRARAALRLNGEAPFSIDGSAALDGSLGKESFDLNASFSGTLREPGIRLVANGAQLTAQADIEATPFAPVPLRRAELRVRDLNPKALQEGWPQADLDLDASLLPVPGTAALTVTGPVTVTNALPGPIDKGRLPLASARADVVLDAQRQQIRQLLLTLHGDGRLEGSGELRGVDRQGQLTLQAHDVDLHGLHTALRASRLSGPLTAKLSGDTQHFLADLKDPSFTVTADARLTPDMIGLQSVQLSSGKAQLDLSGTLARGDQGEYALKGRLSDFNPALFLAREREDVPAWRLADARINMSFDAEGALRPEPGVRLRFDIRDSSYDGRPMRGGGTVHVEGPRVVSSDAQLAVAGNRVLLKGGFGAPSDRLRIDIDAPALRRLGYGLAGLLRVQGTVGGTVEQPAIDLDYRAENLAFGAHRVSHLAGEAHLDGLPGQAPNARARVSLNARDLRSGDIRLARLAADIDGSDASHTLKLGAAGQLRGRPLDLTLAAQGRLRQLPEGMAWDGMLRALRNTGFPQLALTDPVPVSIAPGSVDLGAARLRIEQAVVELERFRFDKGEIRSAGRIRALEVAHLFDIRRQITGEASPFSTDLVLDGRWDVTLADTAQGFVQVERRRGDITLPRGTGEGRLGLTALSLRADLRGMRADLDARVEAARIGSLRADGRIGLRREDGRIGIAPDAPIGGSVVASIPRLQALAFLTGPDIAVTGSLSANLTLDGTLADPRISGPVNGDNLALVLYDQGVRLRDGIARLQLRDSVVEVRQLLFRGGEGTLRVTGSIPLRETGDAGGGLSATIVAENLQLLSNPSGRMTVSGQAQAATVDRRTQLTGKFVVDRALFSLPERAAPELGDDVVVIRNGKRVDTADGKGPLPDEPQPPGPFSPMVNILVDLGDQFRFEGSGAELRLAGELRIRSAPGEAVRAFGTVRVVDGSYEAFGTELAIERGVINFQGPVGNPNVNILAMRRGDDVEAGVQVSGTVQRPRVQLVSEPEVPEAEKLSWLVFGSAGGREGPGQAQSAARGAALGLLNKFGGERIAQGFGLDELSIGESEFGLAGQQVINLGKEISDRLFIGYEQSLAGAESVLKLTYELTRNWSVVLRGGAVTGVEMYFSKRFDTLR